VLSKTGNLKRYHWRYVIKVIVKVF
jgi:hypothetical protein